MRAEKQFISQEYVDRLNRSPFFLIVDYRGLKVSHFSELRKRLSSAGSEVHVVKNTLFRVAVKEAGIGDLSGALSGQLAVVMGQKDISAAAKILKSFSAEFEKPKIKFGFLGNQRIEPEAVLALADLPSIEVLRAKLLGLFLAPAGNLVRLLNTPATQLARVLQARVDKGE